jgi:monoamine oxidase
LAERPCGRCSIFGESDERFHIRGGNQQLPEAIADHLGLGDRVVKGHSLVKRAMLSLPKKSPFFRASYSFYRVGQYTTFAGYEAVRQGGVLFCGEHTSIDFQGFMEGGAAEGTRAARELRQLIRS